MNYALTLGSFVFFTALVGIVTWWLTRGDKHDTSSGYFLAGRSLTGGYIAGSLMLTNLSTEQLVGLNGAAFSDGLCVMAWEVIAGMSLVLMALFFLPKYLKSGIATIPEFLEKRFDGTTRAITSIIFIIAYAGILLPIILYTGATGMNGILNVPELTGIEDPTVNLWILVWLIGILGSIYAIFGGLRTVAVSDTLNGVGLLIGGFLIFWGGLVAINPEAPLTALNEVRAASPAKFNSLGADDQSVPFSTLFTGVLLLNLFYWCTNQQIIQRTFGASSLKEGQKGVLMAGFLKILAPVILVLPGIMAFHLFGRFDIGPTKVPIVEVIDQEYGLIVENQNGEQQVLINLDEQVEFQGKDAKQAKELVGTELVNDKGDTLTVASIVSNGTVITVGEDNQLATHPYQDPKNYIAPRNKDQAYGKLVQSVLPGFLIGFFAAAIVGAILSSFNSALNSTSTLFSLGVYQHFINPNATEQQVINSGKAFGWIIAILAMCGAPMLAGQESIFGYLQQMNGLYFIPIFSVVLIGILSKRVPSAAANTALILGFSAIAAGYFIPNLASMVKEIHEFHFLGLVFASLIILMLVWGAVAPRAEAYVQEDAKVIDLTPWPYAYPVGIGLVISVLGLYLYFADFSAI